MKINVRINWKDYDKSGKLISEAEHEANSLVNAFINIMLAQMRFSTVVSIPDTGGTSRTILNTATFNSNGASGDATLGIVVGTGQTAVTIADYALETLIAHGTGAGQLSYGTVAFDSAVTTVGSTKHFNISRTFTNNSGGDITIYEAGIIVSSSNYKFLIDHTLSTKEITNGNSSTCTYKISITV